MHGQKKIKLSLWSYWSCSDQVFEFVYVGHLPTTPLCGIFYVTPQEKVVGPQIWW